MFCGMVEPVIKKINNKTREKLTSSVFLMPSFIGVMIFFIIPFVVVIFYSMVDGPISKNFVFLDNFRTLFQNSAFQTAAKNTGIFSAIAVPLAVILALGLAVLLEQKIPFKSQFRTFFLSPMMVPIASVVLIWHVIFHQNGALNELLSHFGIEGVDWLKSDYGRIVIVLLFLWKNLGYNMVLFMSALSNIPNELVEAARVEGASSWTVFRKIKMRFLSPSILFVTILSIISSFKVFREVYLLTGDYPYGALYMLQHFMNNMFASLDYQKLAAAAVIMAIVMVFIIAVLFIIEYNYGRDMEG